MSDSRRACAEMSTIIVSQLRLHGLKLPVPVFQLNQSCNRIQFQQVDQIGFNFNETKCDKSSVKSFVIKSASHTHFVFVYQRMRRCTLISAHKIPAELNRSAGFGRVKQTEPSLLGELSDVALWCSDTNTAGNIINATLSR